MQSIQDLKQKIKGFIKSNIEELFVPLIVIIVGISGFFLGKISQNKLDNDNIYIVKSEIGDRTQKETASSIVPISTYIKSSPSYNNQVNNIKDNVSSSGAMYVASSRGKLYYRIGCGGSVKLSEANKLFFATKEEAVAKGYKPAKNCAP